MLLSIIIPVYNAEEFIERCILSIMNQITKIINVEIITINDGSTDNSLGLLEELKNKYPIIKIYSQDNKGLGFTRNLGLKKATGNYLWFIDADDFIEGEVLKNIFKAIIDKKPECILFGYKSINLDSKIISEFKFQDKIFTVEELINSNKYSNTVWSKVFSSHLINKYEIQFNEKVSTAEDFDFCVRALYYTKKLVTLKDIGYNYVQNLNSVSNTRTQKHLKRLAKDSVLVINDLNYFLNDNETHFKGRKNIFKPWLNNYLYGLLFSVFRFDYKLSFVNDIIKSLKEKGNYPVSTSQMNSKKKLFLFLANKKVLFFLLIKINRRFNLF